MVMIDAEALLRNIDNGSVREYVAEIIEGMSKIDTSVLQKGDIIRLSFDEWEIEEAKQFGIGDKITRLRHRNNMTVRNLARKLCVSCGTVISYEENKKIPNITQICLMAKIFGVTVDELLEAEVSNA